MITTLIVLGIIVWLAIGFYFTIITLTRYTDITVSDIPDLVFMSACGIIMVIVYITHLITDSESSKKILFKKRENG